MTGRINNNIMEDDELIDIEPLSIEDYDTEDRMEIEVFYA